MGFEAHYWSTDDSRTEVDFVWQNGMEIVPLEVKAERNVKSQSLKSYLKRYRPSLAIRASMLPHVIQTIPLDAATACRFYNLPLYAIGQLMKIVTPKSIGDDSETTRRMGGICA